MKARPPFLSKSRFIKGLQCHKALWLTTHCPELKPEVSSQQQAVFDSGHEVGRWAQKLFPGGVEVPFDDHTLSDQVSLTKKLIKEGVKTIYEAAFSYNNVFVKADILHQAKNGWLLGEVKSGTSFKDVYLNDLAVQFHVISNCGLDLKTAMLLLIDTEYVRQGEIEADKLFKFADLTEEVLEAQEGIIEELERQRAMLAGSVPSIDIGPHCLEPYECEFQGHCWAHIPNNSVFDFAGTGKPNGFALYNLGYLKMEEVPESMLKPKQLQQVQYLNKPVPYVDQAALKDFLADLTWPLSFLDFETTYMTSIPLFDGTSPYQAVPFQLSLHIQDSPGEGLKHLEFLSEESHDPRPAFIRALLSAIPSGQGSILVWNMAFEEGINKKLAEAFPEASEALLNLNQRMVDLMIPFARREFYHGAMKGSYSIKAVLPALVPECSYKVLEIQSGDMAAASWVEMIQTEDQDRREQLKISLLKYCELDTLAMVRILEKVKEAAESSLISSEPEVDDELIEEFTEAKLTSEGIKLRVRTVTWKGPHTPKSQWRLVATLPVDADTLAERRKLLFNPKFFLDCSECNERIPKGLMHDEHICMFCNEKI